MRRIVSNIGYILWAILVLVGIYASVWTGTDALSAVAFIFLPIIVAILIVTLDGGAIPLPYKVLLVMSGITVNFVLITMVIFACIDSYHISKKRSVVAFFLSLFVIVIGPWLNSHLDPMV